jgi:hypothetical protein
MTVRDLLSWMLRESGVVAAGQVPTSQDINDAFLRVNTLLAQWQRKRWLVYHLVDVFTPSTGQAAYYVGPEQSFNIAMRPDKIFSGFFRQFNQNANSGYSNDGSVTYTACVRDHNNPQVISNALALTLDSAFAVPPNQPPSTGIDYPLRVIPSRENYSSISMKGLVSWPQSVFLDTGWSQPGLPPGSAIAYFYPVPLPGLFELHLQFSEVLQSFVNLSDEIILPPEYQGALLYNMIVRTKSAYGLPQDTVMVALAKDALATLRDANFQMPNMSIPAELTRNARYNIFSDNVDR